jgi:hypothetical protein
MGTDINSNKLHVRVMDVKAVIHKHVHVTLLKSLLTEQNGMPLVTYDNQDKEIKFKCRHIDSLVPCNVSKFNLWEFPFQYLEMNYMPT